MTDLSAEVTALADRSLLVLDDDAPLRTRLGRALEQRGFEPTMVGSVQEVLVEGPSSKDPSVFQGRTKNNRIVFFPGEASMEGQMIQIRITDARPWTLRGEALAAVPSA